MPKCGGTSFKKFLGTILKLKLDYHPSPDSNPKGFDTYLKNKISFSELNETECLVGHYNLPGIRICERYRDLSNIPHKLFTILRDPVETAKSGLRYGSRMGWIDPNIPHVDKRELLLRRANYFSYPY